MTVFFEKDRDRWRYDFRRQGKRYQGYCLNLDGSASSTKTEARRAEELVKAQVQKTKSVSKFTGAPTLALAFVEYARTLPPKGDRFGDDRRIQVAELLRQLGPDTMIAELPQKLPDYIAWARRQKIYVWVGGPQAKTETRIQNPRRETDRFRKDATINRYLDCLRKAVGTYCRAINPATGAPRMPWVPPIPALKEIKRIPRPVPDTDLDRIVENAAPWVADAAVLLRHMGFRKAEMLAINIDQQVDFVKSGIWLRGEDTKGLRDEFVFANAIAMKVIKRRVAEARKLKIKWLFWYTPPPRKAAEGQPHKGDQDRPPPRPIKDFYGAWRRAIKRAGLPKAYRIHDLKASFVTSISGHTKKPQDLQELARHKSFETTLNYLGVFDPDKRAAVDAMAKEVMASQAARGRSIRKRAARSGR